MSITFAAEITGTADTRVFAIRCDDGTVICERVGYGNAYAEAQAHGLVCTKGLCQGYGADVDEVFTDGAPVPVNMANRNAHDIVRALGYSVPMGDDPFGEENADDFLGRVDLALALAPADPGLPEIAWRGEGGAVNVDCARRPGYLQDRLRELRELAVACQRAGLRVVWG